MTGEMESQNDYDDSGLPGPGAPTPLSSLEVSTKSVLKMMFVKGERSVK